MAKGDWHPDSRIRHTMINIQVTEAGLHHIGVGYDVVSPNGSVITSRGWSWPIPTKLRKKLEAILAEMNAAVVEHEGVVGMDFPKFPEHTPERKLVDATEKATPRTHARPQAAAVDAAGS